MAKEVIETILALFRIRQLMRIEEAALMAVEVGEEMNAKMGGTPPRYEDSRPPDGDDYNRLWVYVSDIRGAMK